MIPQGTLQCAICEDRYNTNKKRTAFRSYFPERKMSVCEFCIDEFRNSPEYEHLRPDVDPNDRQKVEKIREYYKDTHIYF